MLLLLLPSLWLPASLLLGLWALSLAWIYHCYLRAFEACLIFEPAIEAKAEQDGRWLLEDISGRYWELKLDYLSSQLLIFSCLDGGKQSILVRTMFSAEDWRQLQLKLRWPK